MTTQQEPSATNNSRYMQYSDFVALQDVWKLCLICGAEKKHKDFYHFKRAGLYCIRSECRKCTIDYQRKSRQKKAERLRKRTVRIIRPTYSYDEYLSVQDNLKQCSKCGASKATYEFYHYKRGGRFGIRSECKKCTIEANSKTYYQRLHCGCD